MGRSELSPVEQSCASNPSLGSPSKRLSTGSASSSLSSPSSLPSSALSNRVRKSVTTTRRRNQYNALVPWSKRFSSTFFSRWLAPSALSTGQRGEAVASSSLGSASSSSATSSTSMFSSRQIGQKLMTGLLSATLSTTQLRQSWSSPT